MQMISGPPGPGKKLPEATKLAGRTFFLRRLLPDNFIHNGSEGRARVK